MVPSQPAITPAALAEVRASARAHAFDHYLAALLAPRAVRGDLIALAATLGEIARVPRLVREPMIGEIRLAWWRDWLAKPLAEGLSGNLVADSMRVCIARHALPAELIAGLSEARVADLYAETPRDWAELEAYADRTAGAGLRLAARILGVTDPPEPLFTAAGRALGLTGVLRDLPYFHARGRDSLPPVAGAEPDERTVMTATRARHALEETRRSAAGSPRPVICALLPVALVEPYLRALQRAGHGSEAPPTDISPLARVWRIWRAHVTRRF